MVEDTLDAEVIGVFPNKVKIGVFDLATFQVAEESLRVGSFLKISDNENVSLICIIESFSIEMREVKGESRRQYVIDAYPLGTLKDGVFKRGGDELAIPPKKVVPATREEIAAIYSNAFLEAERFAFSSLSRERSVRVPVQGDRFFNKHIAVVGATGSGKSSSIASIIQRATSSKSSGYQGLNNSHVVVFDIHGEYRAAFPNAAHLSAEDITLPYWLMNDSEMEDMFLESGDNNNYNQDSLLRSIVTTCKEIRNPDATKVHFDSALPYDISHLSTCFLNLSRETKDAEDSLCISEKNGDRIDFKSDADRLKAYCIRVHDFAAPMRSKINKGPYADGTIDKFVRRIEAKITNPRLNFIFGERAKETSLEDVLRQLLGFSVVAPSNVVVIDLSGVPFDVLSLTVSLISRLIFDYGYYFRRQSGSCETPLLLVYEEAHKYAPKSALARYKASLIAIERIAKEGRKYGVSLLISSQRPSEISETIFSQCSNFVAMRLTNPEDQAYVRRLLPDTLGNLTSGLPSLEQGEALLIGDAVIMPSLVYVDRCDPEPDSHDIPYYRIWQDAWRDVDFTKTVSEWKK